MSCLLLLYLFIYMHGHGPQLWEDLSNWRINYFFLSLTQIQLDS